MIDLAQLDSLNGAGARGAAADGRARNVSMHFVQRGGLADRLAHLLGAAPADAVVHAVDGVSPCGRRGRGGRPGRGVRLRKSTLGRIVAGLLPPTAGTIRFRREDVSRMESAAARGSARRPDDLSGPVRFLNPRMRIAEIIGEAPACTASSRRANSTATRRHHAPGPAWIRVSAALSAPFSGGQRQRIGIARALAVKPQFLCATRRWPRSLSRSGADPQPVHAAARGTGAHLAVHQPRPRRGRASQRPRDGDVSRPHVEEAPTVRCLRPQPSLLRGVLGSTAHRGRPQALPRNQREIPPRSRRRPAATPPALPARHAGLRTETPPWSRIGVGRRSDLPPECWRKLDDLLVRRRSGGLSTDMGNGVDWRSRDLHTVQPRWCYGGPDEPFAADNFCIWCAGTVPLLAALTICLVPNLSARPVRHTSSDRPRAARSDLIGAPLGAMVIGPLGGQFIVEDRAGRRW